MKPDSRFVGHPPPPFFVPEPDVVTGSALTAFMTFCRERTGLELADEAAFHRFSVERFRTFWRLFVAWAPVLREGDDEPVCTSDVCEQARFFPGLRLSYAENLTAAGTWDDTRPAVIACHAAAPPEMISRGDLRERVLRTAGGLRGLGVGAGQRVAAIAGNSWQAVLACLAASALGASFSAAAPDMGADAVVDRFGQIEPVLLFCEGGSGPRTRERLAAIAAALPSLRGIVLLDDADLDVPGVAIHRLSDLSAAAPLPGWQRFPFDHPLFVLFSSGTTGRPKCMVHGAGGTLIEHLKEHRLHGDLGASDRLFFHTSCAWMMWNWQLSALATGAAIVLFDGPVIGPETLWEIAAAQRVTRFGTSPAYLRLCQDRGYAPGRSLDLSALRSVMSTGSILHDGQFDWLGEAVGKLPLQSISGGTDIVGCFVLGNPNLPVWRGEAQCRTLGLDVQAADESGETVVGPVGELVCRNPFPSRPLGFLGDPDGARFHAAYFAANPGVWTHGDLIAFTPHGTARLHGRSDGVINIRGIRIGPAEIDRALQDVAELRACLAVEQAAPDEPGATRLVLLVVLQPGATLDAGLTQRIRATLARRASPAHVPAVVAAVSDLPTTHSGKRSERAACDAINGRPIGNRAALRNPEVLDELAHLAALRAPTPRPAAAAPDASLQERLTAIWETVLGLSPIGADDDFFDLGGHSLLAMQVATEASALFGRAVPVTTLLAVRTIAGLLAWNEKGPAAGGGATLLRDGEMPALFVVPSVSGTVIELHQVLAALTTRRAVYGLQARGVDGAEPPQTRVEDMAEHYLADIRAVQPHGPYALVGYSFGGLVAYEMARRLHAAGEPVALVGLIDTNVSPSNLSFRSWLWFRASELWWLLAGLRQSSVGDLRHQAREVADTLRRRVKQVVGRPDPVRNSGQHVLPPLLQQVRGASFLAHTFYRVPDYPGNVVFFHAALRDPRLCDPLEVWRRCSGSLEVHYLPGDHGALREGTTARAIAGQLAASLAASLPDASAPPAAARHAVGAGGA